MDILPKRFAHHWDFQWLFVPGQELDAQYDLDDDDEYSMTDPDDLEDDDDVNM